MSRRFLLFAAGLLAMGCLVAWSLWRSTARMPGATLTEADIYAARVKLRQVPPPAQSPPKALPWNETVRLAIGSLGCADDAQNRELNDLITAQFSSSRGLELVERQNLETVLREAELNQSGLVRAKDAVRAGKLLRADWFLLGSSAQVGSNHCLVVRLVDARSGITRDGAVLVQKPLPALAAEVAGFVRRQREAAAEAKSRVYLAIGTFEDLSVNNRQADFPSQLRGYLTAGWQHSRFTLLERDYADILLREMELDLAGLTEEGGTNAPAPMQSAFWLVDGYYQSFETTECKLEATLKVQRIFGTRTNISLSGAPGEAFCRKIKDAVDAVLDQTPALVIPSRVSEIRAQRTHGRNLFNSGTPRQAFVGDLDLVYMQDNFWNSDPLRAGRRKRNLEEAMRAFKTVLLLEPGNREAKMFLAACLRDATISRLDEAHEYYREIIEDPAQDKWSDLAQRALVVSFKETNPSEAARFFGSAAGQATNSPVAEFYRKQAEKAEAKAAIAGGEGPKVEVLAEKRLFEFIGSCNDYLHHRLGAFGNDLGMYNYAKTFGTNHALAGRRLAALLPKMKQQFPEMEPYLLAAVVSFQEDTNAPVVAEFQAVLDQLSNQPTNVLVPADFWNAAKYNVFNWSLKHHLYALAAHVMEGKLRFQQGRASVHEADDKVGLAYAYMGLQRWTNALEIFQTFSNQPVQMFSKGPWGDAMSVLPTSEQVAYCREKLGLPAVRDPREFRMSETGICFCSLAAVEAGESSAAFTAGTDGFWFGVDGQLFHLDFNLRTNLVVRLPIPVGVPITCLRLASASLWIGTDGAGLLEYDKTTGRFRHLTQDDGLLMNQVACLHLSENTLWIGYGRRSRYVDYQSDGGLGKLDLTTGQPTSFMPPLKDAQRGNLMSLEPADKPTRHSVTAIADGVRGDIWFITADQSPRLRQYQTRADAWTAAHQACTCLVSDATRLFLGQYTGPLGVNILDFNTGQWRSLKRAEGLPAGAVTTLAPDGNDLWVGGLGYIAVISLPQGEVRKFARVRAESVDQIALGGGYVWARYNRHLYRASLADVR